jgi:hypothetical protein
LINRNQGYRLGAVA